MTREEFINGYCERSRMTWLELSASRQALPCDCAEEGCKGWQMKSHTILIQEAEDRIRMECKNAM